MATMRVNRGYKAVRNLPQSMEVTICEASELPPGERRFVEISGQEILVYNHDGNLFAIPNFCPHEGGPLGRGPVLDIEDEEGNFRTVISCPFHGYTFDIETGEMPTKGSLKCKIFDVWEEGGNVVVDI